MEAGGKSDIVGGWDAMMAEVGSEAGLDEPGTCRDACRIGGVSGSAGVRDA